MFNFQATKHDWCFQMAKCNLADTKNFTMRSNENVKDYTKKYRNRHAQQA